MIKKIIVLLILFATVSCTVQKRHYQKGFYFSVAKKEQGISKREIGLKKLAHNTSFEEKTDFTENELQTQNSKLKIQNSKFNTDSCDVIIYRDGSEVLAKVIEISSTTIKYKRCDMPNGPLYTVKKSEVFMIKYVGGQREVFKEETPVVQPPPIEKNYTKPQVNEAKNAPSNNEAQVHPKAASAFVLGLLAFLCFIMTGTTYGILLLLLSLIFSTISIIHSVKASNIINAQPKEFKGRALAVTGRVLSVIIWSIVLLVLAIVLAFS